MTGWRSVLTVVLCWMVAMPAAMAQQGGEAWRERINSGTVGIISGGVDGTYVRIAADLAAVLDDGDTLRILPVIGKGSVQNIADILYLRGIDIGIVQSDVLAFVRRQNLHPTMDRRIHYVTKLYNEEFHLLAGPGIETVEDLAGKPVNFDSSGSGTYMTATLVFETLGIEVEPTTFDQALALEKLKAGEIAAMVYVAGKPTRLFRDLTADDSVRFLAVEPTPELLETYLPSRLTHEDYPQVIPEDAAVDTVAVGAVMAVYNWDRGTDRYRKVERFIDAFFSRFGEFQEPPRHAKWQEVVLTAQVPGWTRFGPAEEWLRRDALAGGPTAHLDTREALETFLSQQPAGMRLDDLTEQQREALFREFLTWRQRQAQ